jgi:hypothetical protein
MMGSTKLSTIREQLRKSFKMTDAELLGWFSRNLEDLRQKPKANQTEIDTLRLLRDALVKEVKRARPKRRRPRAPARGKG